MKSRFVQAIARSPIYAFQFIFLVWTDAVLLHMPLSESANKHGEPCQNTYMPVQSQTLDVIVI